jgi:hypothetical protein
MNPGTLGRYNGPGDGGSACRAPRAWGGAEGRFIPAPSYQRWLTNRTGTTADRDGGTTGIGLNQTLPVPAQGRVSEVGRDLGLS